MRTLSLIPLGLLLSVVSPAVTTVGQDDQGGYERSTEARIAEFKKFYARSNVKVRRAAVEDFKGVDNLEAARLLVECFEDRDPELREIAQEALGMIRDKKAVEWLVRRARLSSDDALKARLALAFSGMHHKSIFPTLSRMIRHRNPLVRRNAVIALGRQRDRRAIGPLIEVLDKEKVGAVRQALFETLGRLRAKRASSAIEERLDEGHWSVRVAAIEALEKLRTKSGVAALIDQMQEEDGRLLTDIRHALEAITGETRFREKKEMWKEWWDRWGARFKVPSKSYLDELKRKQAAAVAAYAHAPQQYHTIETWSRNMVFCIDISGSMGNKMVLAPGTEEAFFKKYDSRVKIEIVKQELINLVADLESNVNFKIITFASRVRPWSRRMQHATAGNRARAIKKLDSLTALGRGSSGSGRRGGRGGGGSLAAGRTNTYGALMASLEMPRAGRDKGGRLVRTKADTMFFLSDGMPTIGATTDPSEILDRVRRFNRTRKIVIHTIGFDRANRAFMMDLAKQNGGKYVLIGAEPQR